MKQSDLRPEPFMFNSFVPYTAPNSNFYFDTNCYLPPSFPPKLNTS